MMVFEYNIITGLSYRWVDDPGEKITDNAMAKKQQIDNMLTSLRVSTKRKIHI